MTLAAILFMSTSLLLVVSLTAWCYYRLLRGDGARPRGD